MEELTWRKLGELITSMAKAKHSCIDEPVCVIANDLYYPVDIYESLTSGEVVLTVKIILQEEDDD